MNDYHVKVVKVQGEFIWHDHPLSESEMYVVPKGVEHRPFAAEECHILLIEPAGLVNTGDVESEFTAPNDAWI